FGPSPTSPPVRPAVETRPLLAAAPIHVPNKGGSAMALNWPLLRKGQPAPGPLTVEPIRTLQYLLRQHGHPDVVVDGIFGPKTDAAVRGFQQAAGLAVDGIVGPFTWNALVNGVLAL